MLWVVFESPVLGPDKDWDQTGLRPCATETEKDQTSVFFSLGLSLFMKQKFQDQEKTGLNQSFQGLNKIQNTMTS